MTSLSTTIETVHCVLRRFSKEDIPFIFSASRHPGFCDGMRWEPPATEKELIEPYERNVSAWDYGRAYTFTIELKDSKIPVGRIVIRLQNGNCWDLGFWTHPDYQGRGYMTEAAAAMLDFGFKTLAAGKIEAGHAVWNIASRRVMEKAGMTFARHVQQGFQKDGKWVAEDILAITRQEWKDRIVQIVPVQSKQE